MLKWFYVLKSEGFAGDLSRSLIKTRAGDLQRQLWGLLIDFPFLTLLASDTLLYRVPAGGALMLPVLVSRGRQQLGRKAECNSPFSEEFKPQSHGRTWGDDALLGPFSASVTLGWPGEGGKYTHRGQLVPGWHRSPYLLFTHWMEGRGIVGAASDSSPWKRQDLPALSTSAMKLVLSQGSATSVSKTRPFFLELHFSFQIHSLPCAVFIFRKSLEASKCNWET